MIKSPYLDSFKEKTKEEEIVAKLIIDSINHNDVSSILDIGAGNGTIPYIVKKSIPKISITGIEPYLNLSQFPDTFDFKIKGKIEDININKLYDVSLFSHVLGHVELDKREEIVREITEKTNQKVLITTNALIGNFKELQTYLRKEVGDFSYDINLKKILKNIIDRYHVEISTFSVSFSCVEYKDFLNHLNILCPFQLPKEVSPDFKNRIEDSLFTGDKYIATIPQFFIEIDKSKSVKNRNIDFLLTHDSTWDKARLQK